MIPTKIIKPAPSAYQYQLLIGRLLEQPLRYKPDAEIVYRDKSRYTYRDLYKRVSRLSNLLTGTLGIKAGETVGIIDYDSHRFLEGYFAIPMTGAVLHTINFRHSDEEILYAINLAEDKVIFCHKDLFPLLEKLRDRIPSLEKIVLVTDENSERINSLPHEGEYETLLSRQKEEYDFPNFDENSIATLFFTTGTTGLPKAVYFSHRQLVLHTLALISTLGAMNSVTKITTDDVYMPITPMFHVHAWGMPYIATFLGMKQVYPGKYEPGELLRLKREEKVTVSHGVPTLLQMIVSHPDVSKTDLSGWKMVVGGSDLPRGLAKKILSLGINAITGFGMSETGPAISLSYLDKKILSEENEDEQTELRLKAGRPVHFSDVKIRNEAGEFLAHDGVTSGELVVRSPWTTGGYYKDSNHGEELWKDGYLHTGDIGTIDPNGVITIVDRIKDLVKSGGEWVSSSELESLISSYNGIEEVAVIAAPDEKWTEHALAIIVPKPNEKIDEKELSSYLKQFVSSGKIKSFAIPKEYRFVPGLPKTSAGKIDKKRLRASVISPEIPKLIV
jgi:fatty-acyl-CoA synthase